MYISQQKRELRLKMRDRAKVISPHQMKEMANDVFSKVEELQEFQKANTIAFYWSMPDELPTHDWVQKWSKSKQIVLPVTKAGKMFFRVFSPSEQMEQGELNYMQPAEGEVVSPDSIDLMLVPGVAFDSHGGRLGRGRAYYDTYLASASFPKIGVCMAHQMIDSVPRESHDQLLDRVISSCPIE